MHMNQLDKAIIRTMAYFDMLDYPLTAFEIWKYLYRPELPTHARTIQQVADALEDSPELRQLIARVEGFYCLNGRESIVAMRKVRNLAVDRQLRKVVRMVQWLRLFPSIRMIAIASSLSWGNVKETSDIDLFIIARQGQVWQARLWAAGFLKLLRKRPQEGKTRDRYCLSFFITEDNLDVESAAVSPDDIGFQYYVASFMPVYDPDGLYGQFRSANHWLQKLLPNTFGDRLIVEVGAPPALHAWHRFFSAILHPFFNGRFQDWYCNMQLRIMPERLKSIANIDKRVIISDTMLKFHDKDNRVSLRKQWLEKIHQYENA